MDRNKGRNFMPTVDKRVQDARMDHQFLGQHGRWADDMDVYPPNQGHRGSMEMRNLGPHGYEHDAGQQKYISHAGPLWNMPREGPREYGMSQASPQELPHSPATCRYMQPPGPYDNRGYTAYPSQVGLDMGQTDQLGGAMGYPPLGAPSVQSIGADERNSERTTKNMGDGGNPYCIVVNRVISILLIFANIIADWLQCAEMKRGVGFSVKGTMLSKCEIRAEQAYTAFIAFTVVGTMFSLVRIANIIGETLYQVTKGKQGWGWQFLHGFSETFISYLIEDLPQVILICVYNTTCVCSVDNEKIAKAISSCVISGFSNMWRFATCRQEVVPCCGKRKGCCRCSNCCPSCPDKIDCRMFCCYLPIMGDNCCKPKCYIDGLCNSNDGCCAMFKPTDEDPVWPKKLARYFETLHIIASAASFVFAFCILGERAGKNGIKKLFCTIFHVAEC